MEASGEIRVIVEGGKKRRAAPDCSLYTLTLDGITHIVSYEAVVSLYDDLCQEFGA